MDKVSCGETFLSGHFAFKFLILQDLSDFSFLLGYRSLDALPYPLLNALLGLLLCPLLYPLPNPFPCLLILLFLLPFLSLLLYLFLFGSLIGSLIISLYLSLYLSLNPMGDGIKCLNSIFGVLLGILLLVLFQVERLDDGPD